ncbi:MAG TPA: hypothetical protein VHV81_10950 [Steroidobacteraceae bacterium]|jgi:predicted HTH transcriptional regulator|nr:hypothetical protein [Steroidobacteraceae bacterium]
MQVVSGPLGRQKMHALKKGDSTSPRGRDGFCTKCSQDTAHRDIVDLVERGVLHKDPGGGRSTSYSLDLKALD